MAGMLTGTTPAPVTRTEAEARLSRLPYPPGPALASGAPPEPAPGTVGARVLASVRRKPGTLAEVKVRLAGVAASSVRGRLSELVAAGLLTRKNSRFHAVTPSGDAVKSSPVRAAPSPPPARKGKS